MFFIRNKYCTEKVITCICLAIGNAAGIQSTMKIVGEVGTGEKGFKDTKVYILIF